MKNGFYLNRNVYVILTAIILLALLMQISHSTYILQFSKNTHLLENRKVGVTAGQSLHDSGPAYCAVYDGDDEYNVRVYKNIFHVLQYMKKNILSFNTAKETVDLSRCSVTIISNQYLDTIKGIDSLSSYVENGGYVLFANSLDHDNTYNQIYRKLGIVASGVLVDTQGIRLTSNVLIGEKDLLTDIPFITNISNTVELDETSELLASSTKGIPLLWKKTYGVGAFMVYNGTMLGEKINRGLLAGAISLLEPDFIYPVFNSKQMFIDDFPAPIPNGILPSIYNEYKKDIPGFYHDIWWPDMLKVAKKSNLKFTAGLIQTYNNQVDPPFASPIDEDRANLIAFGREVIKSGGEVGIHGYNHQSLQMNQEVADNYGYKIWNSVDDMALSVKEALKFAKTAFPKYDIVTYIPPSNMMSQEGREALLKAWPNLTTISSMYEEDATNMSYVQEFEVAKDGVIEMPRITSGYVDTPFERWAEANTITSLGFYSHFVHPDDALDDVRSMQLTWSKLYEGFAYKMDRLNRTYPWLRAMTATEGAIDVERTLNSQVKWTREGNSIQGEISNFQADSYFVLRTHKSLGLLHNCEVTKIDEHTFLVKAFKPDFEIRLNGTVGK